MQDSCLFLNNLIYCFSELLLVRAVWIPRIYFLNPSRLYRNHIFDQARFTMQTFADDILLCCLEILFRCDLTRIATDWFCQLQHIYECKRLISYVSAKQKYEILLLLTILSLIKIGSYILSYITGSI